MNSQAFTAEGAHHGKRSETLSVVHLVRDEFLGLRFIELAFFIQRYPRYADDLPRWFLPRIEIFLAIEPICPLVVDEQSFSPQEYIDSLVAILDSYGGVVSDLHPQQVLLVPMTPIVERSSAEADHFACSPHTLSVHELKIPCEDAPLGQLQGSYIAPP
jgi:hypothetical protein